MNITEQVKEYFKSQIGPGKKFQDRAKMARFLGLSPTTATRFFNFLDGKSDTTFSAVCDWMERIGFTITPPDENLEGFSLVTMVEAEAGAGESFVTSGVSLGQYAFRDSFLKRERLRADKCVLMRVIGDSMLPLIREGDTILIDASETGHELRDGLVYVIGLDDVLMVKRLAKIPGGWRLCSENPERGNVDVLNDEMNSLRVYGRVRWCGRIL